MSSIERKLLGPQVSVRYLRAQSSFELKFLVPKVNPNIFTSRVLKAIVYVLLLTE